MVFDVNPIAHVPAIAINRNRLVVHCIGERERQKLFGKLTRSIVVSATRDDGVEAKSVVRGANEMFSRSF